VSHLSYKTISANVETATKEWVVVDAKDQTLGRFASHVAYLLRGKHKTNFTPHVDCGDNVIVLNAEEIQLSGTKWDDKEYIWHTGYPSGQRFRSVKDAKAKNKLGSQMFRNLYVYNGTEHPHSAQQPKSININEIK
jgi:large subunit ribosomal protein L13